MYDIFLSHSSKDKALVEKLAQDLKKHSVSAFLDAWHLVPGEPWQEALENAIENSLTVGVCVGPSGFGPWEIEEARAALERKVSGVNLRVIPIILPETHKEIIDSVPQFFRRYTHVDLSGYEADPSVLNILIAGIKGISPILLKEGACKNPQSKKYMVIFSGPSSVGKDVLLGRILHKAQKDGYHCGVLNKFTTRLPRKTEGANDPFTFLSLDEFNGKLKSGSIACYVHSYDQHYGIDLDHVREEFIEDIVFTSLRTREEANELEEHARENNFEVIKIFLNADLESLRNRTLLRSMAGIEKQQRTEQILDDICDIQKDIDKYKNDFNVFLNNSDDVAINASVSAVWKLISEKVKKRK
ncbi:MAG: TIR domain-containing protein [Candidatus Omnitrophica bacterium]|nr:TIR domain-containing protein [Candidatus Omnitrophota bacterium]